MPSHFRRWKPPGEERRSCWGGQRVSGRVSCAHGPRTGAGHTQCTHAHTHEHKLRDTEPQGGPRGPPTAPEECPRPQSCRLGLALPPPAWRHLRPEVRAVADEAGTAGICGVGERLAFMPCNARRYEKGSVCTGSTSPPGQALGPPWWLPHHLGHPSHNPLPPVDTGVAQIAGCRRDGGHRATRPARHSGLTAGRGRPRCLAETGPEVLPGRPGGHRVGGSPDHLPCWAQPAVLTAAMHS